jgi:lipooligosaccharide transport system permease protein
MLETLKLCLHITRRNWMVYKKDFLANIAPTVAEPFLMIVSLGVGLGHFIAQVQGRSYLEYLAPGLGVSTALFTAFFETSYGFYVRLTFENIFKAMLTTPIGPREVVFGEFIWVALKGAVMFGIIAGILVCFGLMKNPWLWAFTPLLGALIALPCGSLGLLASSYVRNINQFQTIYALLISPLFFFSGTFFPVEQMPPALQVVAKVLPLYHGVRLSQALFWAEGDFGSISGHILALLGFTLLFCSWASSRTKRLLRDG